MVKEEFRHKVGLWGVVLVGITCMVGSGWLFGSYAAAKIAGPAAIFAWIVGGGAVLLIALTYVELGAMLPKNGGTARYVQYTHGAFTGFLMAWTSWLATVTVIPVEAFASIQYLSSWHWGINFSFLFNPHTKVLSSEGLVFSSLLLLFYFVINYWGIRLFIRFISAVTIIKILVPLGTVALLAHTAFHSSNFTAYGHTTFAYGIPSVLTAVATSGIIFSFNGFQSVVNLAGEVKNPGRNIPLAIILSVVFVLLLYLALQTVFITSLSPSQIQNGWHNLDFSSPFVQLAIALNLHVLVLSLYADAFISPSGTAVAYTAATSRMLYGISQEGYMPRFMATLSGGGLQVPRKALWINLGVSFLFLWIFRGWNNLIPVVSLMIIISYMVGPIAVMSLRKLTPHYQRPIRVTGMFIIAPIAFVVLTLIFYWARWPTTGDTILIVSLGFLVYVFYAVKQHQQNLMQQLAAGIWLLSYLVVFALLSYIGSKNFGGIGILPYGWDMLVVSLVSLLFYFWGIKSAYLNPSLTELLTFKQEGEAFLPAVK